MKEKEHKPKLEKWKCTVCYNLMESYIEPEECTECKAGKHKLKFKNTNKSKHDDVKK